MPDRKQQTKPKQGGQQADNMGAVERPVESILPDHTIEGVPAPDPAERDPDPKDAAKSDKVEIQATAAAEAGEDEKAPSPFAPHDRALTAQERAIYEAAFPPATVKRPAADYVPPVGPANAPQPPEAYDGTVHRDRLPAPTYEDAMGVVHEAHRALAAQAAQGTTDAPAAPAGTAAPADAAPADAEGEGQ